MGIRGVRILILIYVLSFWFLIVLFNGVRANPVSDPTLEDWYDTETILVFIGCALLEVVVIQLFFSFKEKLIVRSILWIYVFMMNIITIFSLNYYLFYSETADYFYVFLGAEIFVVMIEFSAIYLFFRYLNKRGKLNRSYPVAYIFIIILIANIVSFFAEISYSVLR